MSNVAKLRDDAPVKEPVTGLALLREPFPAHQISKLPKPFKKDAPKGRCAECGEYHGLPAVHLDYVGHAALTERLLDADIEWSWEPMAFTPEGLPAFDKNGGLWIWLTVRGVKRIGYGSADGKTGGDAIKEIVGDALRNSGMRFGAALDLWHKGDLHADESEPAPSAEERAFAHLKACAVSRLTFSGAWEANKAAWKGVLDDAAYRRVVAEMKRLAATIPADEPPPAEPPKDDLTRAANAASATPFDDEIPF